MGFKRRGSIPRVILQWLRATTAIPLAVGAVVAGSQTASCHAQNSHAIERKVRFDIPAQPLSSALIAYAEQAQVQLIVRAETLEGLSASAIVGDLDPLSALKTLLGGSRLGFEVTGPQTITVIRKHPE